MVTYSSYLPKTQNLPGSAGSIVMMNVLVTLFAGHFPGGFRSALNRMKYTLLFTVLPAVFDRLPFGSLFYQLSGGLFFAALTSTFRWWKLSWRLSGKVMKRKERSCRGQAVCSFS